MKGDASPGDIRQLGLRGPAPCGAGELLDLPELCEQVRAVQEVRRALEPVRGLDALSQLGIEPGELLARQAPAASE